MSTPVCKVWDAEQGNYVGIPAIKGADGVAGKSAYACAVTDDPINSLIDTKLGVIENGAY